MAIDLKHWLLKSTYTSDEAALLFVGIEPYDVNLNVHNALYAKIPYAEKAAVISQVLHEKFVEDHDWENIPTIPKEDILSFAEENQLAFPYENTSVQKVTEQKEVMNISINGNQTFLAIIGALATVLAELDENQVRPLKTKKIIRSDGISAKALADILSTRFEGHNLPLKRSNTTISEALKLVKEANKAYV